MRGFLIATTAALVGFGLFQIQDNARAQAPNSSQEQKRFPRPLFPAAIIWGLYIDAVQANFGKPNVTVTLPSLDNNKK